MSKTNLTNLSIKRVLTSLLIFFLIPAIAYALNRMIHNQTIAYTFAFNLVGFVLVVYDWNLFGIHYNRSKESLGDAFLYTIIGIVLIGAWYYFNRTFLNGYILMPDDDTIHRYFFASPTIYLAFSYIQAIIVNICFKCATDHFDIRTKELIAIIASGFLFGLLYTLAFLPPIELSLLIRTFFYNVILITILSYLYNQSSSFLPGILAMGTIYFIVILV